MKNLETNKKKNLYIFFLKIKIPDVMIIINKKHLCYFFYVKYVSYLSFLVLISLKKKKEEKKLYNLSLTQ